MYCVSRGPITALSQNEIMMLRGKLSVCTTEPRKKKNNDGENWWGYWGEKKKMRFDFNESQCLIKDRGQPDVHNAAMVICKEYGWARTSQAGADPLNTSLLLLHPACAPPLPYRLRLPPIGHSWTCTTQAATTTKFLCGGACLCCHLPARKNYKFPIN